MVFDPHDVKAYDDTHMNVPVCPITFEKASGASGFIILNQYENVLECEACGGFHTIEEVIVRPNLESSTHVALENDSVRDIRWYHATTSHKWANIFESDHHFVHVGSLESAYDRALSYYARTKQPIYLYEVTIDEKAILATRFYMDINQNFNTVDFDDFDICRYFNKREDPGSISLAVRHNFIRVVNQKEIHLDEIKSSGVLWSLDEDTVNAYYSVDRPDDEKRIVQE